ncbi:MAG: hypothetical protein LBD15_03230 [Holosporales bacterium]|nr:hypothetical protein [Holosporales bacterium]
MNNTCKLLTSIAALATFYAEAMHPPTDVLREQLENPDPETRQTAAKVVIEHGIQDPELVELTRQVQAAL